MVILAVVIIYALFSVSDIISLKKTKQKKELVIFCILMSVAFVISLLLVNDVKLPSFERIVGDLIKPITGEP